MRLQFIPMAGVVLWTALVPTSADAAVYNLNADIGLTTTLSSGGGQFEFLSQEPLQVSGSGFLLTDSMMRANLSITPDSDHPNQGDYAGLLTSGVAFAENTSTSQTNFRITYEQLFSNITRSFVLDGPPPPKYNVVTSTYTSVNIVVDFIGSSRPDLVRRFGGYGNCGYPCVVLPPTMGFTSFLLQPGESAIVTYNQSAGMFLLSSIPEPTTWSLLIIGLLGTGVAMRSSRKSGTAVEKSSN